MKILVPLDGSTFSETILDTVVPLVEASDSEAHLITVIEETALQGYWTMPPTLIDETTGEMGMSATAISRLSTSPNSPEAIKAREEALHTAEEYLARVVGRFPYNRTTTRAVVGKSAVEETLKYAQEQGVELIAMSTHGRSGLGRWVFGSTADKLLHSSAIPLLLLTPKEGQKATPRAGRVDTLVVPLDGSELAESALSYAEWLARQMPLKISLVRVVPSVTFAYPGGEPYSFEPRLYEEMEHAATEYLRQKQVDIELRGFKVECTVGSGHPAAYVVDFAEKQEGSLIVMSTHGRSGIGRWIMGSVADRVIRATSRPVLLVRPQEPSS
ncbi:MAG: universal stress protein [Chloroflexi bacterium]|nr:universal stress protein [Chloroflexota bacterium]